jgi:hypothetical protein
VQRAAHVFLDVADAFEEVALIAGVVQVGAVLDLDRLDGAVHVGGRGVGGDPMFGFGAL